MTQLLDFLPVLLFAVVFFASDIYWATGALMVAVTGQVLIYLAIRRPITRELNLILWTSLVFGSLTLILRNETFIQWRPTVVNWLLAVTLLGSYYLAGKNLLKELLGKQLSLVDQVWARLNAGWACGFLFAGALNLVVVYNFSMEIWVSYKVIGGFALNLLYTVITVVYLSRLGYLSDSTAAAAAGGATTPAETLKQSEGRD